MIWRRSGCEWGLLDVPQRRKRAGSDIYPFEGHVGATARTAVEVRAVPKYCLGPSVNISSSVEDETQLRDLTPHDDP